MTSADVKLPAGVRLGFRAIFPEIHVKLMAEADSEAACSDATIRSGLEAPDRRIHYRDAVAASLESMPNTSEPEKVLHRRS